MEDHKILKARKKVQPEDHQKDQKFDKYVSDLKKPDIEKFKHQQLQNWQRLKDHIENTHSPVDDLDISIVNKINNGIQHNLPAGTRQ